VVRGRVLSTEFAMMTLMSAAGAALSGAVLDPLGISGLLWWMAGLPLIPAMLWAAWLVWGKTAQEESLA